MELRVLHYFLAVAREQSISAAAQSLHLTQPTLSTQLKALEEELGKQLLVRGTKGSRKVTLTEEGMILRKRAEEILTLVNKAEEEIAHSDDTVVGTVSIGAGETDIVRYFAKAARTLQKRYPDIRSKKNRPGADSSGPVGPFPIYTKANDIVALKRSPSTVMSKTPPCSSVRLRAMESPRPLPSVERDLSPRTKRSISSSPETFSG